LALEPHLPDASAFALAVDRFYAGLMLNACPANDSDSGAEPSLGGKLLYAGELDADGRALAVAGNIAGAATLAATADTAAQKQAFRDGVVDFLVTDLDEALRILKNEIRKRETVAVCVASSPGAVEREMLERGLLPDLLRTGDETAELLTPFLKLGARQTEPAPVEENQAMVTWSVATAPALWLPKLDAIALDCLSGDSSPSAWAARRWLRLAPRYLGRLANGLRLVRCGREMAAKFIGQVRERAEDGEIGVPVELKLAGHSEPVGHQFAPAKSPDSAR
jgi:hypothetical protein